MRALLPGPRIRSFLFDLLVTTGVVGLTSLGIFERETPRGTMWLGYVMAAALLVRRRAPLWSMAVVSLAALAQVVLFPPRFDPLPYDLAVLVGMYSVVKYGRTMVGAVLAAATVATGIVIELVRHPQQDPVQQGLFFVGVCGGVWLMAYTMRTRRLYVEGLEEKAATLERERDHLARIAVADERAAIARELHDVIAHSLAVMIVQADGGRYAFEADPGQARMALDTVAATGRDALEDMRRLVGVLRGSESAFTGGASAPAGADAREPADRRRAGVAQLRQLVDRAESAGLTVDLQVTGPVTALPPAIELAVFRLAQEALTNVMRHAGPQARVELNVDVTSDLVTLSVVDDGGQVLAAVGSVVGGEVPATPAGHGLIGMRERVAVHGGVLTAGPRSDRGWAVLADIPWPRPAMESGPA